MDKSNSTILRCGVSNHIIRRNRPASCEISMFDLDSDSEPCLDKMVIHPTSALLCIEHDIANDKIEDSIFYHSAAVQIFDELPFFCVSKECILLSCAWPAPSPYIH